MSKIKPLQGQHFSKKIEAKYGPYRPESFEFKKLHVHRLKVCFGMLIFQCIYYKKGTFKCSDYPNKHFKPIEKNVFTISFKFDILSILRNLNIKFWKVRSLGSKKYTKEISIVDLFEFRFSGYLL